MKRQELTMQLTAEEFKKLSCLKNEKFDRLVVYIDLLKKWQKSINLVGKNSLFDVWRRHVLDSAQLSKFITPKTMIIADIGTGAGFPGMVLAILLEKEDREFHLIESNERKCAFLREVNLATQAGVFIHNKRIEDINALSVDLVVSRAVASVDKLLQYSSFILKKDGKCIFLKGKKWKEELTQAQLKWNIKENIIQSLSDSTGKILKLEEISPSD
jgi:16S rRNA (guanine527-N7)-methyltransferase